MKKRVLFVDDETRILEGLRNSLRRQRSKWDMRFVGSGREALEALGAEPFDVIVSDLRMPQMDGAALLKRAQDEYPDVVRIVLSGYSELEITLRAVRVAHQSLAKPTDPDVIENVVERACNLQALISSQVIRQMVGKIEKLPSVPRVYLQLMAVMEDENVSRQDITRILKQDPAMCAKILQIVNSAFFGIARPISKIEGAVSCLGFSLIQRLALAAEVFKQGSTYSSRVGLSVEGLQTHALLTGSIASRFFSDKQQEEDAFVACLLHDIGKLVLATELSDKLEKVVHAMHTEGGPMHAAEERLLGVTHAEIGGYLLGVWGLPYPIVEAVANHHAPARVEQCGLDLLAAVHVADILANEQLGPVVSGVKDELIGLDPAYAERLGLDGKMDEWRQMAREQAAALSSG